MTMGSGVAGDMHAFSNHPPGGHFHPENQSTTLIKIFDHPITPTPGTVSGVAGVWPKFSHPQGIFPVQQISSVPWAPVRIGGTAPGGRGHFGGTPTHAKKKTSHPLKKRAWYPWTKAKSQRSQVFGDMTEAALPNQFAVRTV